MVILHFNLIYKFKYRSEIACPNSLEMPVFCVLVKYPVKHSVIIEVFGNRYFNFSCLFFISRLWYFNKK